MVFSIVIFLFSLSSVVLSLSVNNFQKLPLPSTSTGPESIAFDSLNRGPYTGISDGRVVRYNGTNFVDYCITAPNRNKIVCDGRNNPALFGRICGRPIGIEFRLLTNTLYIADAYFGLLKAEPNQMVATQLANSSDGVPFKFLDGLDVHQLTGDVYFTDASARYSLSEILVAVAVNDATGRLLKYNPATQQVTTLMKGLSGPAGVAVSSDGSFLLVTEFIAQRIQKFWLTGPKAFTSEILVTFNGRPDNIKRTLSGDYWVAVNVQKLLAIVPTGIRINATGAILEMVPLDAYYGPILISEFNPRGLNTYVGSLFANFLGQSS
ncbi:hypothetical protein UlMin_008625 [Ulmus minor]